MRTICAQLVQPRLMQANTLRPLQASSKSSRCNASIMVAIAAGSLAALGGCCIMASMFKKRKPAHMKPAKGPSARSSRHLAKASFKPDQLDSDGCSYCIRTAIQPCQRQVAFYDAVQMDYSERWGPAHGSDGVGLCFRVSNLAAALLNCASTLDSCHIALEPDAPAVYHVFWHEHHKDVLHQLNVVLQVAEMWAYDEQHHTYSVKTQLTLYTHDEDD